MADQLKHFFSTALVRRIADSIALVEPAFPVRAFVKQAAAGLDQLELLDRGRLIAKALAGHLPADYPEAIEVLIRSLGPVHATDELLGVGMAPFFYLPHTLFVVDRGLDHFDESMRAQYELTKRFSAESSIRSFIDREPERTFAVLKTWARDRDAHVRRLVSEGTRLRLPWAMRVLWLDAHPERVIELLDLLVDDPATSVQRSVANNINDLTKVHRQLAIATCARWLAAREGRRPLVEHALRSAVKRGESEALELLGFGSKPAIAIENVAFEPKRVAIGERIAMHFELRSTGKQPQELLVDVAVHFINATAASRKVFKLKRVTLAPKQRVKLELPISLAVHTTRKPRPGTHRVEVLVNGISYPADSFVVSAPKPRRSAPTRRR